MERMHLVSEVFRLRPDQKTALEAIARRTRVRKMEYLREALADLLALYEADPFTRWEGNATPGSREAATHALVPDEHQVRLDNLARRSRRTRAAYWLEAVDRVLAKYGAGP